jgi:RNA polymerase sigma factor for flagellar operon FliA
MTMKPARQPTVAASLAASPAAPSSPTREELALFMPLVHQVVARVLRRLPPNVLREDLVAAGTFGLVDALRKSDERSPAFEWYARIRIRGAVVDELRAQDWLTRRTRTRLAKAQANGENQSMSVVGFDDVPEGQTMGFADVGTPSPQEQVEQRMERVALERAVGTLPEREANIVRWHYFEGVAFKEIAGRLGVSEPRISQLHARAMTRLRGIMIEPGTVAAA